MITPNVWKLDEEGEFILAEIPGYGVAPILETRGWGRLTAYHNLSFEDAVAEQRRIGTLAAAAPDLLEALQRCVGSLRVSSPGGDGDPDVEFARAAIEKATRV